MNKFKTNLILINLVPYLLWALILTVPSLIEAYFIPGYTENLNSLMTLFYVFPILLIVLNVLVLQKAISIPLTVIISITSGLAFFILGRMMYVIYPAIRGELGLPI